MSLRDWLANRWLVEHTTSPAEIADLMEVVRRDLEDAAIERLSPDWRMGIAYNAALQLATAALAASGYRVGRERSHERTILSLQYTVGFDQDSIDTLDAARRKRNASNYERAGTTSPSEAAEIHEIAVALQATVTSWLHQHYPHLLPKPE
jgi:hypothetical protein